MAFIMTLGISNGAVLKSSSQRELKGFWKVIPAMNYLFSKFFELLLTGTFKNCTITYP